VHSFTDHLQKGLLTWSASGFGAGQTTRSIWFQYVNQAEVGFRRPPDLIELSEVNPEVENGFFCETNITTLPIWAHTDDGGGGSQPPPGGGNCSELITAVHSSLDAIKLEIAKLQETMRGMGSGTDAAPANPESGGGGGSGSTFGL
jgi:hypothetical protein